MRENLDPVGYYSNRHISDIIKRCNLEALVNQLGGKPFHQFINSLIHKFNCFAGLNGQMSEQGSSISVGQKQLLCLARAVLSPCKIVLIDEATANVDSETDRHLQDVIQQCLSDRTVVTIAHRVDTVLSCDRVLVMEDGNIVESGQPTLLLQDTSTRFSRFVENR